MCKQHPRLSHLTGLGGGKHWPHFESSQATPGQPELRITALVFRGLDYLLHAWVHSGAHRHDWMSLYPSSRTPHQGDRDCIFPATILSLHPGTHTEFCIFLCLSHITPLFRDCLYFSQILWDEKPAHNQRKTSPMSEGVVQLSQKKRDEEKCLKLLVCFHGK